MDFDALRVFVKVAQLASFTRAAEQLHLPKSRVSAVVQQLEAQLRTKLLHRTTRAVHLTRDGEQVLARAAELVSEVDALQTLFGQSAAALRGRLRVDLPTRLARNIVIPRLPEFLTAHPHLSLELSSTDRLVDLIDEGFDCVLRVGNLADSGLIARRLGVLHMVNCASPAYLQAHGVPATLDDLDQHVLIQYSPKLSTGHAGWEYVDERGVHLKKMRTVVTVNSTDAYEATCLAGLGLIQAPKTGLKPWLDSGQLVCVLPQWVGEPMPVSLLYADRRFLPKRVEVFMAWLEQVLQPYLAA